MKFVQNTLQTCCLFVCCMLSMVPAYSMPVDTSSVDNGAVILMYHNVADNTPPSTSVSPVTFNAHMQYLADNNYTVWPLFKTLLHLARGKVIPAKTVVLTFDDAYRSVYDNAFPILKDKGWPFTIFVTTQYMEDGYSNYMSWQQLLEMKSHGAEVGNHSQTHPHLNRRKSSETEDQWRRRIIDEIHKAQYILHQKTGYPIWVLAYPYGEYDSKLKKLIREMGYFGLGQHSGAVSYTSDMQALSRYPMATGFDSLEDFAIKVASKKLPVTVLSPTDGIVLKDNDIPVLTIRLEAGNYKKQALTCYANGQGRIQLEWIDKRTNVVKVRANSVISPGRTKYNCTAPSATEPGVFYWFSFLWMKLEQDGSWYQEQ